MREPCLWSNGSSQLNTESTGCRILSFIRSYCTLQGPVLHTTGTLYSILVVCLNCMLYELCGQFYVSSMHRDLFHQVILPSLSTCSSTYCAEVYFSLLDAFIYCGSPPFAPAAGAIYPAAGIGFAGDTLFELWVLLGSPNICDLIETV
ncbi:hypothetical protein FKM82_026499 [Ascaphus truei]